MGSNPIGGLNTVEKKNLISEMAESGLKRWIANPFYITNII